MKHRGAGATSYVVLIVVAAVLAILGFVWVNSRSRASLQALSVRNLLQWGIALNLHLVENEDRLPEVGGSVVSAANARAWYNALPSSIGQPALTQLPPDKRPKPGDGSLWMDPATKDREARGNWSGYFFSLGMNYWLQPKPTEPAWKIYKLADPSRTIFLTQNAGPRPGAAPATVVYRYGGSREKAAAMVLFCDGHVAPLTRPELSGTPGSGGGFAMRWRPFDGAPDPDYEDIAITPLPEEGAPDPADSEVP